MVSEVMSYFNSLIDNSCNSSTFGVVLEVVVVVVVFLEMVMI